MYAALSSQNCILSTIIVHNVRPKMRIFVCAETVPQSSESNDPLYFRIQQPSIPSLGGSPLSWVTKTCTVFALSEVNKT